MDLGLQGKRALVTAAGRGLGESIAKNLAKEGAMVAIVSRTRKDLDHLMVEMGGHEKGHYQIAADLTAEQAPTKVMTELEREFGHLDILINNLGSALDIKDPLCSLEDWRKVYRINLEVAIEFNNIVIPHMRRQRWGRIVSVSSTAGMENNGPATYCTMKSALTAYTRCMGRIFAPDGIVVSAILPGAILTKDGYWDEVLKINPTHAEQYLATRCPLGEFGEPDDIGTMVAMLCSKQAKFCQGSIFPVDGGQSRHFFWTGAD